MKPFVEMLPPPNTPAGLPQGLQRGGIFQAAYVPATYLDAQRMTVPTDSPRTEEIGTGIFAQPVGFADPNQTRMITGVQGFGRIQGMGPQPGFIRERVGPRPLPVRRAHPVRTPGGDTEGGIFGQGAVIGGMSTGPRVPMERTMRTVIERGYHGFGAGPDGLGGCGYGGCG